MESSGYVHLCAAGETFDSVALMEYGSSKYAPDIMCMNPGMVGKTVFTGDEVLVLPVVTVAQERNEPAYVPETAPWK